MYQTIQEEELDEMISQEENADIRSKQGESWKLINSITRCKAAKQKIVKGKSKEERLGTGTPLQQLTGEESYSRC